MVISAPDFKSETAINAEDFAITLVSEKTYKIDQVINLHANVFNSTGSPLFNTDGVGCYINIFSGNDSSLQQNSEMDFDEDSFNLTINKDVTHDLGEHDYLVFCNTSTQGGFRTGQFSITYSGFGGFDNDFFLIAIILIPFLISGLFLFVSNMLEPEKYSALKLGLVLVSFVFVYQSYEFASIALHNMSGSTEMINAIADAVFMFTMVYIMFFSYILIQFIKDLFDMFGDKQPKTGEYEE